MATDTFQQKSKFEGYPIDGPAPNALAVTPHDTTEIGGGIVSRALYVGTAGHVTVKMQGGQTVTFSNVPAGTFMPVRVTHVTTATTAGSIVALW